MLNSCHIVLLVVCIAASTSDARDGSTCKYTSIHPKHTACLYPHQACKLHKRNITAHDVGTIVRTHNQLRQKVAGGSQPGQPSAANMRQLKWDSELAFLAQTWADQCKFDRDCDECRQVERFPVGQQVRIWSRAVRSEIFNDSDLSIEPEWEHVVTSWYDAVKHFTTQRLILKYSFSLSYGTYTQLVWANTSYVGCGFAAYTEKNLDKKLYVCNYGDSGNVLEEEVYKPGPPCSKCPDGWKCSTQFPSLCGQL